MILYLSYLGSRSAVGRLQQINVFRGPQNFDPSVEVVVLPWKWAKLHNWGFSMEIVRFWRYCSKQMYSFGSLLPAAWQKT